MLKRTLACVLFVSALTAGQQIQPSTDFPRTVHILDVQVMQGAHSEVSNGNGSGSTYTWKLYRAQVEGERVVYDLDTHRLRMGAGTTTACVATFGWGCLAAKRSTALHVGDYPARWNKDGSLEIAFIGKHGKLDHQTYYIQGEHPAEVQESSH